MKCEKPAKEQGGEPLIAPTRNGATTVKTGYRVEWERRAPSTLLYQDYKKPPT